MNDSYLVALFKLSSHPDLQKTEQLIKRLTFVDAAKTVVELLKSPGMKQQHLPLIRSIFDVAHTFYGMEVAITLIDKGYTHFLEKNIDMFRDLNPNIIKVISQKNWHRSGYPYTKGDTFLENNLASFKIPTPFPKKKN